MVWFKDKTASLRKNTVFTAARILTPILYREFKNNRLADVVQRLPRPFTIMLQQQFKDEPLIGVEIGFGLGNNALSLLSCLNLKKLYCVDPYIGKQYVDFCGEANDTKYPNKFTHLKTQSNVTFIELPSDNACENLPNDLDFVYVDGLHEHFQCLRDLQNYYKLIRIGGFIGGHDFVLTYDSTVDMKKPCFEAHVVKAVFDFSLEINQVPTISMPDFWFEKK